MLNEVKANFTNRFSRIDLHDKVLKPGKTLSPQSRTWMIVPPKLEFARVVGNPRIDVGESGIFLDYLAVDSNPHGCLLVNGPASLRVSWIWYPLGIRTDPSNATTLNPTTNRETKSKIWLP
jgi:hypothetical protein